MLGRPQSGQVTPETGDRAAHGGVGVYQLGQLLRDSPQGDLRLIDLLIAGTLMDRSAERQNRCCGFLLFDLEVKGWVLGGGGLDYGHFGGPR